MCGESYKNKVTALKEFKIYEDRYDKGTSIAKRR